MCPTGAIRALPLHEKAAAHMGLAIVDEATCLPLAGREACTLCSDECTAAGYQAIEFQRVHPELDDDGFPLEGSGFVAPIVVAERCVGCGLCQSRCNSINAKQKRLLEQSAIIVRNGPGREDRMANGSYVERHRAQEVAPQGEEGGDYLPDFLDED